MNPFAHATVRDSSPAEVDALESICERLQGFEHHLSLDWVDGFLTALAAGPRIPEQEVWLKALAEDAVDRCFADPTDRTQAERALATRLKVLSVQLDPEALLAQPERLRLSPLMVQWTDEDRARAMKLAQSQGWMPIDGAPHAASSDPGQHNPPLPGSEAGSQLEEPVDPGAFLQTGLMWAAGVLAAVEAFDADWALRDEVETVVDEEDQVDIEHLLQFVVLLGTPVGSPAFQELYADLFDAEVLERDDLITTALLAVQEIKLLWLDRAAKPVQRRVEAKPGRNDPCYCGSGKKYKKCHGLQEG